MHSRQLDCIVEGSAAENWKKDSLAAEIGENSVRDRNWRKVPSAAETEDRHHVLPAVSVPLANET